MKANLKKICKWIYVTDGTFFARRKTMVFTIYANDGELELGRVYWLTTFRCYAFSPHPHTIYEKDCLRDIATFCEEETKKHYEHCKMLKRISSRTRTARFTCDGN